MPRRIGISLEIFKFFSSFIFFFSNKWKLYSVWTKHCKDNYRARSEQFGQEVVSCLFLFAGVTRRSWQLFCTWEQSLSIIWTHQLWLRSQQPPRLVSQWLLVFVWHQNPCLWKLLNSYWKNFTVHSWWYRLRLTFLLHSGSAWCQYFLSECTRLKLAFIECHSI